MHQQPPATAQLVLSARMGDEEAFAGLVRATRGTLYAAALAITRSEQDAQDAVQQAVLKAWEKIDTLKEPAYFATWITRITIRTAINIGRRRKQTMLLMLEIPTGDPKLDERMDVRRAINELDEKTRICTVLYYFEDMSIEQIATASGLRPGTVKSRLHRARAKLRTILEGYDHGDD